MGTQIKSGPINGLIHLAVAGTIWILGIETLAAQESLKRQTVRRVEPRVSPPVALSEHPLAAVQRFADARYEYIKHNIHDYTCLLVKRDRVDGYLFGYQYLDIKVRMDRSQMEPATSSLSVYAHYLAPKRLRGRKVLFVSGQNDGKMLVRKGGHRFSYFKTNVDLDSGIARRESRHPITELDIRRLLERLIEQVVVDMSIDSDATNTQVRFFKNAKVDGRGCTRIEVLHPKTQKGLEFYLANVYVDDQLHVPIRIEGYDWPKSDGQLPPLIEEYTYTKLRLNVGLTDADFSPSNLD